MRLSKETLYHGSKTPDLKTLKPNPSNLLGNIPVVFATSDIRFALSMIHGTGEDLDIGYFVNTKTGEEEMYIKELKPGKIKLLELPGYLYEVENKDFHTDSRLSHAELINNSEIRITNMTIIPNVLKELMNHDVSIITKN